MVWLLKKQDLFKECSKQINYILIEHPGMADRVESLNTLSGIAATVQWMQTCSYNIPRDFESTYLY